MKKKINTTNKGTRKKCTSRKRALTNIKAKTNYDKKKLATRKNTAKKGTAKLTLTQSKAKANRLLDAMKTTRQKQLALVSQMDKLEKSKGINKAEREKAIKVKLNQINTLDKKDDKTYKDYYDLMNKDLKTGKLKTKPKDFKGGFTSKSYVNAVFKELGLAK